jgi:drug/metabolite transporter (DMT)-like permease
MNKSPSSRMIDLMMLAVVLIWGANFAVVKAALSELPPMVFNALRFGLASIFTLLLVWIVERDLSIGRRDRRAALVLGFLGNFVYQVLYINGLAGTTAGNSSLILATTPIFVAIISSLSGIERLHARNWLGVVLSFAGILLLINGGGSRIALDRSTLAGNLLVLGSTITWALYTVLLRPVVGRNSALRATAWIMASSSPLLILAALPGLLAQDWRAVSLASWLGLLYSSALGISLAYVIWTTGVQRLGSTRTAIYSYMTPLVAVSVAWVTLGEKLRPLQMVGAAGILLGVALARQRPVDRPTE